MFFRKDLCAKHRPAALSVRICLMTRLSSQTLGTARDTQWCTDLTCDIYIYTYIYISRERMYLIYLGMCRFQLCPGHGREAPQLCGPTLQGVSHYGSSHHGGGRLDSLDAAGDTRWRWMLRQHQGNRPGEVCEGPQTDFQHFHGFGSAWFSTCTGITGPLGLHLPS